MCIKEVILAHAQKYPLMQAQDYVKLLYQSAFGCGHMVSSFDKCLAYLLSERKAETGCVYTEDIGNGYARLYLEGGDVPLSTRTLANLFYESASEADQHKDAFFSSAETLLTLSREGSIAPSETEIKAAMRKFRDGDFSPVSHTQAYRDAYAPAYRVIRKEFSDHIRLISALDTLKSAQNGAIIAIDGMCASGKTTLSRILSKALNAPVLHMDDFFLPPVKRTKERLAAPGGNVDHERFLEEVLLPLKANTPFSFRPFDCSIMDLSAPIAFTPGEINIVEGSYSCHPSLFPFYDQTVFLSVDSDLQVARILKRNGELMLKRFVNEWIPMENAYFNAFSIKEKADFRLHTDK